MQTIRYIFSIIVGYSALTFSLKCKSNISGGNYNGDISRTKSGLRCQRWDRQTPHSHDVTATILPDATLADASNYCRSPDFDPGGPWCFTTEPDVVWEYCDIPKCKDVGCRDNEMGVQYIGILNKTASGIPCEHWPTVKMNSGEYSYGKHQILWFPDEHRDHNLCRNPFGQQSRPWCHLLGNENREWEYCDVPLCDRIRDENNTKAVIRDKFCRKNGGQCVEKQCCVDGTYVPSLCAEEGKVCCMAEINCNWQQERIVIDQWPQGSYALPRSIFDCPNQKNLTWLRGYITIQRPVAMAGTGTTGGGAGGEQPPLVGNKTSELHQAYGIYSERLVHLGVCLRNQDFVSESAATWPMGKYCIYRYKDTCPAGFEESKLDLSAGDVEFSVNFGFDRACDLDPKRLCLYFCCRNDAQQYTYLPTNNPFHLLMNRDTCPEVKFMNGTKEYIEINLSQIDLRSEVPPPVILTDTSIIIGYCQYEQKEPDSCYDPIDQGFFYRGKVNMTSQGACSNWDLIEQLEYWKLYHHVGLENSVYCRNSAPIEFLDQPWCYVHGLKVRCDIPKCDYSPWEGFTEVGRWRPSRQTIGGTSEAQLANDGLMSTCSKQLLLKAWWQMDLQGWYNIHAVRVYRTKVEVCVVRLMDVHVGMTRNDFLEGGSTLCARNQSMGSSVDGLLPCTQPVLGQYITLYNLRYYEWESATAPYSACFGICEVNAYVEDSTCGRRLLERSRGNKILPTFLGSNKFSTSGRDFLLNNAESWCGEPDKSGKIWFLVDLLFPRRLQGFAIQGAQGEERIITKLRFQYGLGQDAMVFYEEYAGEPKEFMFDPEEETPQQRLFQTDISARLLLFEVLQFSGRPCVRLDVLGCIDRNVNLLRNTEATDQSSMLDEKEADLAVDNDIRTCSETMVENGTWWMAELTKEYSLHSLVLYTGITFFWNRAGRKPAVQSTTDWGGDGFDANDGNMKLHFWHGSCSHTSQEKEPWWFVDFGEETLVTDVFITNRIDCCEARLNKFQIFIGDLMPVEGRPINTTQYGVCVTHDRYYGIGETRLHTCDQPLIGRYLIVMLNAESQYLTLCEVQVFGDRDPFLIGMASRPPPEGQIEDETGCQFVTEPTLGSHTLTFKCLLDARGEYVIAQAEGLGVLTLCDSVAYGGRAADVRNIARSTLRLSCMENEQLHLEPVYKVTTTTTSSSTSTTSSGVYIRPEDLQLVQHYCQGQSDCLIPATPSMSALNSDFTLQVAVFCTVTFEPATICSREISSEEMISTPNFPFYYGLDYDCVWRIVAPSNKFVTLNITSIALPDKPQLYRDGCTEINPGNCTDSAIIYYGEMPDSLVSNDINIISDTITLLVTQPSLFISDSNVMTVHFKSCYRNVQRQEEWQGELGLTGRVSFSDCDGCKVQTGATITECSGRCGQILTQGYPYSYQPRTRSQWRITVEQGTYVTLSFESFDVYENAVVTECIRDYVEILDVDLTKATKTVGRYCNSRKPPSLLKSSWSDLIVLFISDIEISGQGFLASYRQNVYQLPPDFPTYGSSPDCRANSTLFMENCYQLVTWHEPLIWLLAEEECTARGGHLVAINSRQEMVFLHYMLTTQWQTDFYRTFIGLNDRKEEGVWEWVDGSPVTFTDWSPTSDQANIRQPDGAAVEDCTMIRLDSIHDTRSWHDIPCAYDKVQQFLCETGMLMKDGEKDSQQELELPEGRTAVLHGSTECNNGEFILEDLWCDGMLDCHDQSDESNCPMEEGSCMKKHYQCDDGSCISMSLYCDYKPDCMDGSDELYCVKLECGEGEYTCANGQCIWEEQRCDLATNCQDGSDERDCTICAENAFQCFDSTCIPKEKRCDTVVDCPGALHEDESDECAQETVEKSCLDWKTAGAIENGKYLIRPEGVDAFEVECDFTSDSEHVITMIHHDSEESTYVTGYGEAGDYVRKFDYKVLPTQIDKITSTALRCEQFVQLKCYATDGLRVDYWMNRYGVKKPWIDVESGDDCACVLKSACNQTKECECTLAVARMPRQLLVDEDYMRDIADLPLTGISLSGTAFAGSQYQYHVIGPLVCYEWANKTRDDFKCASGQWIPSTQRCMYTVNKYGELQGCRDMSHLENCEGFVCPVEYMQCGEGHCIGVERICDGAEDCMEGEDELNCANFTCPGQLRCVGETKCASRMQRCDGIKHCQAGNDERNCDIRCPPGCQCTGLAYQCGAQGFDIFPKDISHKARMIDFQLNALMLHNKTFEGFIYIGLLNLSSNGFAMLPTDVFHHLINVYSLDLSHNNIGRIDGFTFEGMVNLRELILTGNMNVKLIKSYAFYGLDSMSDLNLRNLGIEIVESNAFIGLPKLKRLDLSSNKLLTLENVLVDLPLLVNLNISKNTGFDVSRKELAYAESLFSLQSDHFKFCCFVNDRVTEEDCLPERDEFSSCEDLMRRDVLKVFLWVLGLMAFLCNLFVLVYRKSEKMTVYSFSVMNLAVADFFMGVYMVVLASVDAFYRGVYIEYADSWTHSWTCQFLGFLNTFSSETSVFILCVISGDRFYKIVFPLQGSKFGMKQAKMLMALMWLLGFVVAALPLFPLPYFGETYYGKSSVCISIYLTQDNSPGWEFSVGVSHVLNFTCFMFIFVSYSFLFRSVKQSGSKTKSFSHGQKPNQNDVALARRLTLVVFTDFICWVPINLMGAMAGAGVSVPGEVYAWVVVFLLPINSALNPLLYTISSIRVKAKAAKASENMSLASDSTTMMYFETSTTKQVELKQYLVQYKRVQMDTVYKLCIKITSALNEIHTKGYCSPDLDATNTKVAIAQNGDLMIGLMFNTDPNLDQTDDIHALGKLISYLLRRNVAAPGRE